MARVPRVLATIAATMPIHTVTNCSDELGHQAAALVSVPFEVMGPRRAPEPTSRGLSRTSGPLDALALSARRVLSSPGRHTTSPEPGGSAWVCGGTTGSACAAARGPDWSPSTALLDPLPAFVSGPGGHQHR